MKLRTAKKIVKVIEEAGLEEATRRYNKARISKAQRIWKGLPEKAPQTTTIQVEIGPHQFETWTVTFGEPFEIPTRGGQAASVYEALKRVGFVARNKKRKRLCEKYRSYKAQNRTLCKFKFPHIKETY